MVVAQFPEIDYTIFKSLAEKLEQTIDAACERCDTANILLKDNNIHQILVEKLGKLGFRSVSDDVFWGSSALVFEANHNQMLRIVSAKAHEPSRPDDACVLQPLMTYTFGEGDNQIKIELLPKVHTLYEVTRDPELSKAYHISGEDIARIVRELTIYNLHKGNVFFDPDARNIGIIRTSNRNNIPVIIDPAATVAQNQVDDKMTPELPFTHRDLYVLRAIKEKMVPDLQLPAIEGSPVPNPYMDFIFNHWNNLVGEDVPHYKTIPETYKKAIDEYLDALGKEPLPLYDFAQAQKDHLQQLGLEPGQAAMVMGDADLERWHALQEEGAKASGMEYDRNKSMLKYLIQDKKLYPKEALDILAEAATPNVEPEKNFRERVEKKATQYLNTKW